MSAPVPRPPRLASQRATRASISCFAVVVVVGALVALPCVAQPAATPYAKGDAAAGEALGQRDCVSCHAAKFGSAEAIYVRKERRVTTPQQLMVQVQRCNAELSKGYFPDEEESVAAWLDRDFYHFTR